MFFLLLVFSAWCRSPCGLLYIFQFLFLVINSGLVNLAMASGVQDGYDTRDNSFFSGSLAWAPI